MGTPRSLLDFVRAPKPVYGPPSPHAPPPSDLPASLTALIDLVRGATLGAGDDPNRWLRAGELAAAVPFGSLRSLTGLVKGATKGGFFSRVDDAVARLIPAKGAHPNKVASLLKSNASAEELAYRKVPEFLAGKGNATVTPAELQAHLAEHPAPGADGPDAGRGRVLVQGDVIAQSARRAGRRLPARTSAALRRRQQQRASDRLLRHR